MTGCKSIWGASCTTVSFGLGKEDGDSKDVAGECGYIQFFKKGEEDKDPFQITEGCFVKTDCGKMNVWEDGKAEYHCSAIRTMAATALASVAVMYAAI